jgi:hypothetical protein
MLPLYLQWKLKVTQNAERMGASELKQPAKQRNSDI